MKVRETAVAWGAVALFAAGVGLARVPLGAGVDFVCMCDNPTLAGGGCAGSVNSSDCCCCSTAGLGGPWTCMPSSATNNYCLGDGGTGYTCRGATPGGGNG